MSHLTEGSVNFTPLISFSDIKSNDKIKLSFQTNIKNDTFSIKESDVFFLLFCVIAATFVLANNKMWVNCVHCATLNIDNEIHCRTPCKAKTHWYLVTLKLDICKSI